MGSGADRYLGGRTRAISLAAVAGVLAWGALFVWLGASQEESGAAGPAPPAPREEAASAADRGDAGGPSPDVVTLSYGYDIRDERLVVGLSDNVFAGRVERVAARRPARTTIPGESRPQTQYAVRVLTVVKSTGADPFEEGETALVNREGGVSPKTGRQQVVEAHYCGRHASDRPLAVGSEYLFSTYYERRRKLHTLVAQPTGALPIDSGEGRGAIVAAYRLASERQEDPMTLAREGGEEAACD
jgi:hypothetical protein